uniref:Cytochrome P450 18a1 (inferred by orthology to a D. melanogaster protein) n=1 Tax=Strongyloides venezuelensis TaxID=75913 RepID=A0A0K0EZ52_STRVS
MIEILLLSLIILYLFNFYKKVKALPPGPIPLPIIGNLLSFDFRKIHFWIYDQKKTYGSIFTIWIPTPQVVFADYDSINEALVTNDDNFLGRNINGFPEKLFQDKPNVGVFFSEGEEWRDQRRLSMHILRDFGMSRTVIQDKIHPVIHDFWEYIDNLEDKDNVDLNEIIDLSVGNIINHILFGFMYTQENKEELFEFTKANEKLFELISTWEIWILNLIPSIAKISSIKYVLYKRMSDQLNKFMKIIKCQIDECKKSYNPNDEPSNFVHAVMREIESIDSKYSFLNSDHLEGMILDFWSAGVGTTSVTLRWFILFVMKHIDIQKKLQDEIDEVIGSDQLVQLSDKIKMPYMNAFITEGNRYANIGGLTLSRRCTKDTFINGYLISKNTLIQPFFWGANMDEKYFKDPFTFNPNRFLDSEGNFKVEHEPMSFGKGKRICAGKSLADAELFLIFTSLLQKYKFTHPYGPIDLSSDSGVNIIPRPYKCKIEKR